ncbi:MAG: hypothetical protein Q9195_006728 [Heterodermia aff. obscurata]
MRDTWQRAIRSHEQRFTSKDLVEIKKTTKPDDLLGFITTFDVANDESNISRIARRIGMLGVYFSNYEHSLNMIAQGLPSPGCLVWGSIKFTLTFIRNYTKMFEKLLEALESMGIYLRNSGFSMDVVIFQDSPEYRDALKEFFDAFIAFWSKALKFSKKKRLRTLFRSLWANYNSEFGALRVRMESQQKALSQCAKATSRKRIHEAQIKEGEEWEKNEASREEARDNTRKSTQAKVLKFLALGKATVDEYESIYNKIHKSLHPGTCQWILKLDAFQTWAKTTAQSDESMLWISAVPGAGKSFLYAFLVDYLRGIASADSGPILFYMVDGRNVDNNSSLSVACSLAYQLLSVAQIRESLLDTINDYAVQTGQSKATNFEPLWDIVSTFIKKLSKFTLVLDGLDECEDRVVLLRSLIELLKNSNAKIIVLSRREADFIQLLDTFPQVRFGKTDTYGDVLSFLQAKILSSDKLRELSQNKRILRKFNCDLATILSKRSDGSFLWARTALREIESKAKTAEMIEVIEGLPSDLQRSYEFILEGYHKGLDTVRRRIFCMILRWLICAARPLSGKELKAAVEYEYLHLNPAGEANDDSVNNSECGSDDEFYITQAEIEELCGSLVVVDRGSMQLAHISIAEFLRQRPQNQYGGENIDGFFVNVPNTNRYLTMVCVDCLQTRLGRRAIQKKDRGRKLHFNTTDESTAFLVYCINQWPFHLSQSVEANLEPIKGKLKKFLVGSKMPYWLEFFITIEGRSLWTLEQRVRTILPWCVDHAQNEPSDHELTTFINQWSKGILSLLERHGPSLEESPSEIHFIDPRSYDEFRDGISVFSGNGEPDASVYDQHFQLRSKIYSHPTISSGCTDSQHKMDFPRRDFPLLGLVYFDRQRSVILSASWSTEMPELRCQEILTGRKLQPMRYVQEPEYGRDFICEGFCISPDSKFLALLYYGKSLICDTDMKGRYDIVVWKLPEKLSFNTSSNEAWCEAVKIISYETPFICSSPMPLAIDSNNNLYSFWGCMRIEESDTVEAANTPATLLSARGFQLPARIISLDSLCFSPDCRFIIAYDRRKLSLLRFLVEDMTLCSTTSVSQPEIMVCCVSCSGRFVVWRDLRIEHRKCYIHDFEQNKAFQVPGSEHISPPARVKLKFTLNEDYLIGSMGEETTLFRQYVSIWSPLSPAIQQSRLDYVPGILGLHLTNFNEPLYLATLDQWIEIDLICPKLSKYQLGLYSVESHRVHPKVSQRGDKAALFHVTQQRGEVEIWDLASEYRCQKIELRWHEDSLLSRGVYCTSFSPDLSLLLVNNAVYKLNTTADFAVSITVSSPEDQVASTANQGSMTIRDGPCVHAMFSTCNRFLLYLNTGSIEKQMSPKLDVYQATNSKTDMLSRILLPMNLDLSLFTFAMAEWHPTLPILGLVTCQVAAIAGTEEGFTVRACYTLNLDVMGANWIEAREIISEESQRKHCDFR